MLNTIFDQGIPFIENKEEREAYDLRCKRDIYADLKIALDVLKGLDDKLNTLHPNVRQKIHRLITG